MSSVALPIGNLNPIVNRTETGKSDKTAVQALFCGLGEDWWKQIIDGKYHHFGPMVFDRGLNGRAAEAGFFPSLINALNFTKEHLCEPLTLDFYCRLHKVSCSHFRGRENNTEMHAKMTGLFRPNLSSIITAFGIDDIMEVFDRHQERRDKKTLLRDFFQIKKYEYNAVLHDNGVEGLISILKITHRVSNITLQQFEELDALFQTKYQELKEYIGQLASFHHSIPEFELLQGAIQLNYPIFDPYHSAERIIDDYNRTIATLNQETASGGNPETIADKKLEAIADIYQKLEWLHPFPDGQGRSDLILLSKLLAENGFNPPILFEPYVSSYCSLKEWTAYLKEGIQKWKDLKTLG